MLQLAATPNPEEVWPWQQRFPFATKEPDRPFS
jgi:hypothetical protein